MKKKNDEKNICRSNETQRKLSQQHRITRDGRGFVFGFRFALSLLVQKCLILVTVIIALNIL